MSVPWRPAGTWSGRFAGFPLDAVGGEPAAVLGRQATRA